MFIDITPKERKVLKISSYIINCGRNSELCVTLSEFITNMDRSRSFISLRCGSNMAVPGQLFYWCLFEIQEAN